MVSRPVLEATIKRLLSASKCSGTMVLSASSLLRHSSRHGACALSRKWTMRSVDSATVETATRGTSERSSTQSSTRGGRCAVSEVRRPVTTLRRNRSTLSRSPSLLWMMTSSLSGTARSGV